ncbi:MAG: transcriptional regulator [bacterium]|nr:transcriptional regulator [bacterium]
MDYEAFLDGEPVFTGSDLAAYLADRGVARPAEEADRLEERWLRSGRVVAVRPGLFAVVSDGIDPARFQPMPSLVATKMAPDAVVSHHAALDFWGISYSLWFDAVYSATDPAPPMVYGAVRYRGVRFPERLIESSNQHFGVVEQSYADGAVRVTTIERTLVDTLADPDYGGSWDEIYQSLTRADSINVATVAAYCQARDGGAALRAKVGFFLDQHRELWGIADSDLDQFRPQGPRATTFIFDTFARKRTRYIEDWNLVVPVEVVERQWEMVF